MKQAILLAGLAAAAMLAPAAMAQTTISAGYSIIQVDATGDDVTLGALSGRISHEIMPLVALEGELAVGVTDDSYAPLGSTTPVDVSLDYQIGAFAVGRLPIPALGAAFARAGYARTELDDPGGGTSEGGGFAYGGGLEFDFIPLVKTRLEYTEYQGSDAKTFGISAALRF